MPVKPRILLVEDNIQDQEIYARCLGRADYDIVPTRTLKSALSMLESKTFDVILVDLKMLGDKYDHFSGFEVLERVKSLDSEIQVIVITGYGSSDLAWRAIRNGAFDYITKGKDLRAKLPLTVQSALDVRLLKQELLYPKGGNDLRLESDRIIANSSSMQEVFEKIYKASSNTKNILIEGERGTGKRLIAQTIHLQSSQRDYPLKVIDCARLIELPDKQSEQPGMFDNIDGGTIFLADVCDLQPRFQSLFLDLIVKYSVNQMERSNTKLRHVRIIASTHKSLNALVDSANFLRDLFYTIYQTNIFVPPLRDRKDGDDILALAAMFLQRHSDSSGVIFSSEALSLIKQYDYPGNVEELENIIKYVLNVRKENLIRVEYLPPSVRNYSRTKSQTHMRSSNIGSNDLSMGQVDVFVNRLDLLELVQLMVRSFNLEEVRTLCFGLNVDYDNLEAVGKEGKIRELIAYFQRRQELQHLLDLCHELRPNTTWPPV